MRKIRRLTALLIGHLPFNALRVVAYRFLMGYDIGRRVKIGFGTAIHVQKFVCGDDVQIRRGNSFIGPIKISLGARTFVGRWNRFECGDGVVDPSQASKGYKRLFACGPDCLINESHLFDVLGSIEVGAGTWIAGFASQFLTHGAGVMNRDIEIGSGCFLGSAVRMAPGSGISNHVILGMGSVVTKRIADDNVIVGGLPAKVIRARGEDDAYEFTKVW